MKKHKMLSLLLAVSVSCAVYSPAAVFAQENVEEASAETDNGDGYHFYETASGLSVTVSENENAELPTVAVLATGGTIAGTGDAGKTTNYSAGQLDVGSLVESAAGITDIANVRGVQVCNVGSDDITGAYWLQIVNTINEMAQDEDIDGFVITHGTDTLDETAYFLNLTVKTEKPVVLTGAMRPSTATSADGPMNLYQSIALAANADAAGRGSMVVFSDGIYGGRDVQKISTFQTDAFTSKDFGCMGYMLEGKPYFYNESTKLHTTETEFDVSGLTELPDVAVAYFTIDADEGVLDYYVENGAKGIIIAGAGAGCYSASWNDKVNELAQSNIPVIRCSRIGSGLITKDDYFVGNLAIGNDLAPQKASVLLRLALTVTDDINEIQEIFNKY
ncbi:MAG: asparaginase [Eubacteriales bacterium]|nr:asparaginase [Eubacteriales bacterium]